MRNTIWFFTARRGRGSEKSGEKSDEINFHGEVSVRKRGANDDDITREKREEKSFICSKTTENN